MVEEASLQRWSIYRMLVDFVGQYLKPTPSKISITDSITPEKFFQCSLIENSVVGKCTLAILNPHACT